METQKKELKGIAKEELEETIELCEDIYKYYEQTGEKIDLFNIEKPELPDIDLDFQEEETLVEKEKEIIFLKQSFFSQVAFFAVSIIVAVLLSRLISGNLVQETLVEGHSMNPTLSHKERLLLNKFSYEKSSPERYDIVVFSFNNGEHFVKRIIGLPGEKVTIKEGRVYINDRVLLDDPVLDEIEYAGIAGEGVVVGKDQYFVLGDNRNHSYDSRYEEIGTINKKVIHGKIWFRFFPISKIGIVK